MPAAPWHIIVHLWEKSRSTPESSDVLAVDYKALLHVSFLFQPEWMQFLNSLRYGMCSCPLASLVPPTGLAPVCLSVLYWGAQRWMQCSSAVTQALRRGDRAILGPADCLLCCEATLLAPCRFFSTQVKRSPGTFYRDASQVLSPQACIVTQFLYHRSRIYICLSWSSMRFPAALFSSVFQSLWAAALPSSTPTRWLVLSTNLLRLRPVPLSRSLVKTLNITDPDTNPWNIPLLTDCQLDFASLSNPLSPAVQPTFQPHYFSLFQSLSHQFNGTDAMWCCVEVPAKVKAYSTHCSSLIHSTGHLVTGKQWWFALHPSM